jgi:hypothetical protein
MTERECAQAGRIEACEAIMAKCEDKKLYYANLQHINPQNYMTLMIQLIEVISWCLDLIYPLPPTKIEE